MIRNMDKKLVVIYVLVAALVVLGGYIAVDKSKDAAYADGFDDGAGYILNSQVSQLETQGVVIIPVGDDQVIVLAPLEPPEGA